MHAGMHTDDPTLPCMCLLQASKLSDVLAEMAEAEVAATLCAHVCRTRTNRLPWVQDDSIAASPSAARPAKRARAGVVLEFAFM